MNKSAVCRIANRISQDVSRHDAFVQAWAIVKKGAVEVKAAGTSFGSRPEALVRLATYSPAQVRAFIVPEPENRADPAALRIMVGVQGGRGLFCMGYIPREAVPVVAALRTLPAVRVVGDTV
ncbi:MAG: HIRAN domain-containing protein, partial [Spirochaetaceae bacterium]|nr:HIRAN domain-containing protein [Spirochaetaceae bacterium]